jgi:hypothetical protein
MLPKKQVSRLERKVHRPEVGEWVGGWVGWSTVRVVNQRLGLGGPRRADREVRGSTAVSEWSRQLRGAPVLRG